MSGQIGAKRAREIIGVLAQMQDQDRRLVQSPAFDSVIADMTAEEKKQFNRIVNSTIDRATQIARKKGRTLKGFKDRGAQDMLLCIYVFMMGRKRGAK